MSQADVRPLKSAATSRRLGNSTDPWSRDSRPYLLVETCIQLGQISSDDSKYPTQLDIHERTTDHKIIMRAWLLVIFFL